MRPIKAVFLPLFGTILPLLLLSAATTRAIGGETIRINGSGTGLALMKPMIEAYVQSNPGVSFEMGNPLGSSGGIKALRMGALDMAVSCRPLQLETETQGLTFTPVGRTPLAIVVGRDVPIKDVSTAQLEAIFSGRLRKWANRETIRVVLRPLEDIDTKILRGLSPGMDAALTQAHDQRGMITAVTDPESNQAVARMAGSIGTAGLTGILVEKTLVTVLSLNGVVPTTNSLEDGSYPLAKEINLVTRNPLPIPLQHFLEFVRSSKGHSIAEKFGVLTTAKDF